ncbi:MAG: hypothetical protein ACK5RO_12950 [Pseudobdellovibrionaceae bacterium]
MIVPATAATPLNLDATNIIRKIMREERESREKLPYQQAFKAPRTTTPVDERILIVVKIRDEKLDRDLANQTAFRAKAGNLSSNDIIVLDMRNVAKKNEFLFSNIKEVSPNLPCKPVTVFWEAAVDKHSSKESSSRILIE